MKSFAEDCPEAEAASEESPGGQARHLTPRKLAAQREWLQQLKEAVIGMDLTTMHALLERATGSNDNVVDGYQQPVDSTDTGGQSGSHQHIIYSPEGERAMNAQDSTPDTTNRVRFAAVACTSQSNTDFFKTDCDRAQC